MPVFHSNGRDEKKIKQVRKGTWLYVIEDIEKRVAKYEDARLCARYKVTHAHPILGGAMCGSKSAEQLLRDHGTVYTSQPKDVRGYWEPSPQVDGPLKAKPFGRKIDAAEIIDLEEQSIEARDRRRKSKSGKGKWF